MMELAEKEAKKKWCPFSVTGLHAGNGGVSVNRAVGDGHGGEFDITAYTRCLGSECMAWQFSDLTNKYGYCGLARK